LGSIDVLMLTLPFTSHIRSTGGNCLLIRSLKELTNITEGVEKTIFDMFVLINF